MVTFYLYCDLKRKLVIFLGLFTICQWYLKRQKNNGFVFNGRKGGAMQSESSMLPTDTFLLHSLNDVLKVYLSIGASCLRFLQFSADNTNVHNVVREVNTQRFEYRFCVCIMARIVIMKIKSCHCQ